MDGMSSNYPPGPRDLVFGLTYVNRFRSDPLGFVTDLARDYGDFAYARLGCYPAYFVNRPLGSRLGAWASAQSAVIPDRAHLERQHAELMAKYPDGNVPRPPHWGGYRVLPAVIEFWQGRPSRLHDRIRFTRRPDGGWKRERLSP